MTWLWITLAGWAMLSVVAAALVAGAIGLADRYRPRTSRFPDDAMGMSRPRDVALTVSGGRHSTV